MSNNISTTSTRVTPVAAAVRLALAGILAASSACAFAQAAAAAKESTLQEVKIIGAADQGYAVKSTTTATKTDTLLRDTPQAITVITAEQMRDQAMQSMSDVVRYVPGLAPSQGEGNRDAVLFRGNNSTSDFYIDGIRDDVQYFRDFYNIDSVEALKGSNAMIFGRGGSGGVINRVSKQPQWTPVRQASLAVGSHSSKRASIDVGQAIDSDVAFRVNAMVEESDSYRNGVSVKRSGFNPTMAIRSGANTSVVFGYEHFDDERVADRGISSQFGRPYDTDDSTFFGSAELSPTWAKVDALTAVVDHAFANGATLRNRTRLATYDKFYQNIFASTVVSAGGNLNLGAYSNATQRNNFFNQTDLTYHLSTGSIKHKLLGGVEYGHQETDNVRLTGYRPGTNTNAFAVSAANPAFTGAIEFRPSATDANNHSVAKVAAVYIQDQIEFTPQWHAIVGLRYDRFDIDFTNNRNGVRVEQQDTEVSPRVGLIYKPVQAVSIYASASRSFVPRAGEQLSSVTPRNNMFDPEEFQNTELGAKWDITPELSLSTAFFRLERSNVLVGAVSGGALGELVDGQTTKGFEIGLAGKLSQAWSVMGGAAYNDATLSTGKSLSQVPERTLSLWNRYEFSPQWAAGLGLIYRDSIYASASNNVELPSFTRLDAALFYNLNKNFKLQLNLENMLDKKYYASAHSDTNILPGSPRALRLTLNTAF